MDNRLRDPLVIANAQLSTDEWSADRFVSQVRADTVSHLAANLHSLRPSQARARLLLACLLASGKNVLTRERRVGAVPECHIDGVAHHQLHEALQSLGTAARADEDPWVKVTAAAVAGFNGRLDMASLERESIVVAETMPALLEAVTSVQCASLLPPLERRSLLARPPLLSPAQPHFTVRQDAPIPPLSALSSHPSVLTAPSMRGPAHGAPTLARTTSLSHSVHARRGMGVSDTESAFRSSRPMPGVGGLTRWTSGQPAEGHALAVLASHSPPGAPGGAGVTPSRDRRSVQVVGAEESTALLKRAASVTARPTKRPAVGLSSSMRLRRLGSVGSGECEGVGKAVGAGGEVLDTAAGEVQAGSYSAVADTAGTTLVDDAAVAALFEDDEAAVVEQQGVGQDMGLPANHEGHSRGGRHTAAAGQLEEMEETPQVAVSGTVAPAVPLMHSPSSASAKIRRLKRERQKAAVSRLAQISTSTFDSAPSQPMQDLTGGPTEHGAAQDNADYGLANGEEGSAPDSPGVQRCRRLKRLATLAAPGEVPNEAGLAGGDDELADF